jgi:hypothetical protein
MDMTIPRSSNPGDARISPVALAPAHPQPSSSQAPAIAPSEHGLYRITEVVRQFARVHQQDERARDAAELAERRRHEDQIILAELVESYGLVTVQEWLARMGRGGQP